MNILKEYAEQYKLMMLTDKLNEQFSINISFFLKKISVFNNNHYLASTIYQLTLMYLKTLLYYKL